MCDDTEYHTKAIDSLSVGLLSARVEEWRAAARDDVGKGSMAHGRVVLRTLLKHSGK